MDFDEFVNKLHNIDIDSVTRETAVIVWDTGIVKELLTDSYESSHLLDGFDFGRLSNQIHWFASAMDYPVGGGTYVTLNITGSFRDGLTINEDMDIISTVPYFQDIKENFEKKGEDVVTIQNDYYVELFDKYFNEQFRKSWGI